MDNNSYWNQKQQEQNGNFGPQAGQVQNPYGEQNYVYTESWMNSPAGGQQANPYGNHAQQPQQYYGQPVPGPGYPKPSYGYPMKPRKNGESGFAIAGMVCGILSILCCSWMFFDFLLAIPGLIFSIVALVKNYDGKGMAVAGLICSTIGLFLSLVFLAVLVMI